MQAMKPYSANDEEVAAVRKIFEGYSDLQRLGWKDPRAMIDWGKPERVTTNDRWKDELFYAVSLGSTGFSIAQHLSNDALHAAWACEANDLWPICVLLVKPKEKS